MKTRKKLQAVCDSEDVSPACLMQSVLSSPESLTFHPTHTEDSLPLPHLSFRELSLHPLTRSTTVQRQRKSSLLARNLSQKQQVSLNRQLNKMKQAVDQKQSQSCKLIFEKNNLLEGIVRSQKIKNLQNNFLRKIKRTATTQEPVELPQFGDWQRDQQASWVGLELPPLLDNCLNLLSVLQIITLLVVYSLSLIFEELRTSNQILNALQAGSLLFYFLEIILGLVTVKSAAGRKVELVREIVVFYLHSNLWVDAASLLILVVDLLLDDPAISYLRLFIIFKLPQCLDKIEKLQVYFIRNVYNQQYWELAKVFLVNFCYAHLIALFLAAMAGLNTEQSWMLAKGLEGSGWAEQYVWSFYWANNIMLTVGFGDIVASNYQEAICLIFIETFSCIIMAYNINCVGSIISSIRAENQQRSKKFKIFKKLTHQNFVPEDLAFKINNYIEESSNLRKKFNHEEDQDFLADLPSTLRLTYLREANKEVLKKLVFFRGLLDRTLCNFAEHIETRISHPQEIIRAIDDDFNLIILRKGQIGYVCKRNGCGFNDEIVDLIRVGRDETPFLTSLDFISKQRPLYEIKSLQFSVLFTLQYSRFIEIFRTSDMDYELFCFLRDKIRNIPDEFEVLPCEFCKNYNHFKFSCPRLHYAPYEQHIVDKELYKEKHGRNERTPHVRNKEIHFSPVEYFKKLKDYREGVQLQSPRERQVTLSGEFNHIHTKELMMSDGGTDRVLTNQMLESVVDAKTREIIEMEFVRLEKREAFDDEVWIVNTETMSNYNSYFSQDNPHNLSEKFSPEARRKRRLEKMELRAEIDCVREESEEGQGRSSQWQSQRSCKSVGSSLLIKD